MVTLDRYFSVTVSWILVDGLVTLDRYFNNARPLPLRNPHRIPTRPPAYFRSPRGLARAHTTGCSALSRLTPSRPPTTVRAGAGREGGGPALTHAHLLCRPDYRSPGGAAGAAGLASARRARRGAAPPGAWSRRAPGGAAVPCSNFQPQPTTPTARVARPALRAGSLRQVTSTCHLSQRETLSRRSSNPPRPSRRFRAAPRAR